MQILRTALTFVGLLTLSSGCGTRDDSDLKIKDGHLAYVYSSHLVTVDGMCSGTLVGTRAVLTAAHCKPVEGAYVYFYRGGDPIATAIEIAAVHIPPGVNPQQNDYVSDSGKFADIAVLTLDSPIPSGYRPLRLGLSFPGAEALGFGVGAGQHDGKTVANFELRWAIARIASPNDYDGGFYLQTQISDVGDTGGPFLVKDEAIEPSPEYPFENERIMGVLHGPRLVNGVMQDYYTSVNAYENWKFVFDRI